MPGRCLSTNKMPYCLLVTPSFPVSSMNNATAIWCTRRIMKPGRRYSSSSGSFCDVAIAACHLLPGPVVDRVLVGGAGRNETPAERPLIVVVEAVARVRRRRGVQQSRQLEVFEFNQAAGLLEQVVGVFFGVLVDRGGGARLGPEHLRKRRAVQLIARCLAAGRMGFDQDATSLAFGDTDPRLLQAYGLDLARPQRLESFTMGACELPFDIVALHESFHHLEHREVRAVEGAHSDRRVLQLLRLENAKFRIGDDREARHRGSERNDLG